jgi:hypothetical protein
LSSGIAMRPLQLANPVFVQRLSHMFK